MMTTLATRTREIGDIEDFDIQVIGADGKPIDPKTNGFPKFDYDRKAKGDMTVSDWKANRFNKIYKNQDVQVLKGDGSVANGNVKLSTVRKSYEEGAEPAAKKAAAKKVK
jgi:hypothetical protein